jgi:hypothetical protein
VNEITLTVGGSIDLVLRSPPAAEGHAIVTAICDGFRAKGTDMAYTLPADKMVAVRVDYVDAEGHPATVDGAVTWDSSAPEIATVAVDPTDSQNAEITPGSSLGTAQISATADADLGAGTRELVTLLDVTIVAGEAVAGVISPTGDPQPIP